MVPIGGTHWMLLFAAVAGLFALVVGLAVGRRLGPVAGLAWFGLLWSIAVIAVVTLVPAQNGLGYIPADAAPDQLQLGHRRPGARWVLDLRRRSAAAQHPAVRAGRGLPGLAFGRWRGGWVLVPLGLLALAAYSLGIEETQLHVARIDRACDVTDIIDNVTGAAIGVAIGLALLPCCVPGGQGALSGSCAAPGAVGTDPRSPIGWRP